MQRIVKRNICPDDTSVFKLPEIVGPVEWYSLCSLIICLDRQWSSLKSDSYRVCRVIWSSNLSNSLSIGMMWEDTLSRLHKELRKRNSSDRKTPSIGIFGLCCWFRRANSRRWDFRLFDWQQKLLRLRGIWLDIIALGSKDRWSGWGRR